MHEIIKFVKDIFDNWSLIIIILIAILSLLLDAPRFKNKGHTKEYKIVRAISYSYITISLIIFILLRVG